MKVIENKFYSKDSVDKTAIILIPGRSSVTNIGFILLNFLLS